MHQLVGGDQPIVHIGERGDGRARHTGMRVSEMRRVVDVIIQGEGGREGEFFKKAYIEKVVVHGGFAMVGVKQLEVRAARNFHFSLMEWFATGAIRVLHFWFWDESVPHGVLGVRCGSGKVGGTIAEFPERDG